MEGQIDHARLSVASIHDPESAEFRAAVEIYLEAFPTEERLEVSELAAFAAKTAVYRDDHFWALLLDGLVTGLATFSYLPEQNVGYAQYLGIERSQRNGGIGSWAIGEMLRQLAEDAARHAHRRVIGMSAAVERPEDAPTEDERQLRARRLAFYERLGAVRLPALLPLPPAHAGAPEFWYEFILFPGTDAPPAVTRGEAVQMAIAVLRDFCGLPPDSALITRLLSGDS